MSKSGDLKAFIFVLANVLMLFASFAFFLAKGLYDASVS